MRTYLGNDINAVTAADFEPFNAKDFGSYGAYTDDALDGGAPGSAVVPSVAVEGKRRLILDYRPAVGSLSVTIDGVPAALGVLPSAPASAGACSIDYLSGQMEFHASDAGKDVVAAYNSHGSVLDAGTFNAMQKRLEATDESAILTTKGDLLVHDGTNAERLPVGTDGQVLTADSSQAAGVKWEDAADGAGVAKLADSQIFTGDNTFTGNTLVDADLTVSGVTILGDDLSVTGNIDAPSFTGDGSALTGTGGIRGAYDIEREPASPLTLTDECEGGSINANWTVVNGASGTANLLGTVTSCIYDRTTRAKGMLIQGPNNNANKFRMRAPTIASGEQVIMSYSMPSYPLALVDNFVCGMSLNNSTTNFDDSPFAIYEAHVGDKQNVQFYKSGVGIEASSIMSGVTGSRIYLRIVRSGSDYHVFWSHDGTAWGNMGVYNGTVSYIWVFGNTNGATDRKSSGDPIWCINWIRHTAYTGVDPW